MPNSPPLARWRRISRAGTAAAGVAEERYDVVVMEGHDRVGGRIRTIEIEGVRVDAGTTWVAPDHDAMHGGRRTESLTALAPWAALDIPPIMNALQKIVDSLPITETWNHPRAVEYDAISLGAWRTSKRANKGTQVHGRSRP